MTQFDITIPQIEEDIRRNKWLKSYQGRVDRIRALVEALGNVRDWQLTLLEEVARQIEERKAPAMHCHRLHANHILDHFEEYRLYTKEEPRAVLSSEVTTKPWGTKEQRARQRARRAREEGVSNES